MTGLAKSILCYETHNKVDYICHHNFIALIDTEACKVFPITRDWVTEPDLDLLYPDPKYLHYLLPLYSSPGVLSQLAMLYMLNDQNSITLPLPALPLQAAT